MHASAFPGTISARKEMSEEDPTRASPGPAAERGANACPGEARKDARARTRVHRLRGDLQPKPMRTGSHKLNNAQRGLSL